MKVKKLSNNIKLLAVTSLSLFVGATLATSFELSSNNDEAESTSSYSLNRVSKENERTFEGGNICETTATNINCSSLVDNSFIERPLLENNAASYQFLVSFNENVLLHSLDLKNETSSQLSLELERTLFPLTSTQVTPEGNTTINSDDFLNNIENTPENNYILLSSGTPLLFSKTNIEVEKNNFAFDINLKLANGANRDIKMMIKTIPLLSRSISTRFNGEYYEEGDGDIVINKERMISLSTTQDTNIEVKPLLGQNNVGLNIKGFSDSFLNKEVDIETKQIIKSYWNSFLSDNFLDGVIQTNKEIETLKFEDVNMEHMAKDFLNLTGVKELVISSAYNFDKSNLSSDDWDKFFTSNPNLGKISIVSSGLTNATFEPLKTAIAKISHNFELVLDNNELTSIPVFSNGANFLSLSVKSNSLINISSLSSSWSRLQKLDLSYNYSLSSNTPAFLASLNEISALNTLSLKGMNINKNLLFLTQLQTPNLFIDLRRRIVNLDMSENGLEEVASIFNASANFDSLTTLDLSNNNLKSIKNEFFLSNDNDTTLILNDNNDLEIMVDENTPTTTSFLFIDNLKLKNIKKVSLSSIYKNNSSLKSIEIDGVSESPANALTFLPTALTSLTIKNSGSWITKASLSAITADLNSLVNVDFSNNNSKVSLLSALDNKSTIKTLDISNTDLSSLNNLNKTLNFSSLETVIARNVSSLNLNKFLWIIYTPLSNLKKIDLRDSSIGVYEGDSIVTQVSYPNEVLVEFNSIESFEILNDIIFSSSSVFNLTSSNIKTLIKYNDFEVQTPMNSSFINATELKIKNELREKSLDFIKDKDLANNLEKHSAQLALYNFGYTVPKMSQETMINNESYAQYLNRLNDSIENNRTTISSKEETFSTIDELEENQEKIKNQLNDLVKDNENLIKNLNTLDDGALEIIIISLLSIFVAINLTVIFVVWKKRKAKRN